MSSIAQAVSCIDGYDPDALRVDMAREAIRVCLAPVSEIEKVPVKESLGRVLAQRGCKRLPQGGEIKRPIEQQEHAASFAALEQVVKDNPHRTAIAAHGFQCLGENCEVFYQMSEFYHAGLARGLRWNDPAVNIRWPITESFLSERDRNLPLLADLK